MIWDLSLWERVGAVRMAGSFASFLKTSSRAARDLETGSSVDDFTAAVYY